MREENPSMSRLQDIVDEALAQMAAEHGSELSCVSATVKTTILIIAHQPIPPTQSRHLRQRIFTISTNAGAYASTDKRTMFSGGAGRGGEEPDRRVGFATLC